MTIELSQLVAPAIGLLGVIVGVWITQRWNIQKERLTWEGQALKFLYAPLLIRIVKIRTLSRHRQKFDSALSTYSSSSKAVESQIEYDNNQLTSLLLPLYREVEEILRENSQYADETTLKYYVLFVEFLEAWDRSHNTLAEALALKSIRTTESQLHSFYYHIQNEYSRLQKSTMLSKKIHEVNVLKELLVEDKSRSQFGLFENSKKPE